MIVYRLLVTIGIIVALFFVGFLCLMLAAGYWEPGACAIVGGIVGYTIVKLFDRLT